MKCIGGIWLPAEEQHLVEWMTKTNCVVNGKLTYQYSKLKAAMKVVPHDRRRMAVDVGAHVGLWTMHLAAMFEQVAAFEPNVALAECFANNVAAANVTLYPQALGPAVGRVALRRFDGNTGHTMNTGIGSEGDIPIGPLDAFGFNHVDFIKIDVEGYEPGVLKGAMQTIVRCRPVMVVECKGFERHHGYQPNDAVKILLDIGMEIHANIGGDHIMVWS